jgi:hypothetical protein
MVATVQEIGQARQQLYVMGLLELAIGLIMTLLTVCSVWLRRRVKLMLRELEVGNADAGAISSRKKMLQSEEKATIAWALTCGVLCVFWQGEYAVFNSWMTKSDPDDHWFLRGWSIYARADKRYLLSDAFIVSMEGLSALVLGPLLLWFAWCVLQRRPERDVCGILVSSLQLYTYTMYFATAMKDSQHIAPSCARRAAPRAQPRPPRASATRACCASCRPARRTWWRRASVSGHSWRRARTRIESVPPTLTCARVRIQVSSSTLTKVSK